MSIGPFFQQEPWVLQSASADQPIAAAASADPGAPSRRQARARQLLEQGLALQQGGDAGGAQALWRQALRHAPGDLLLMRAINQLCPPLNAQPLPRRRSRPRRHQRPALLLPGRLRCLDHSRALLERLCQHADLFICTEAADRQAALSLRCRRHRGLLVVNDHPALAAAEAALPVPAMKQWHKLALCLQQVRQHEERIGRRYTHLIKLRSDYLHVSPEWFFEDLLDPGLDGLATASDKVFAGPRDLMLLFESFPTLIAGFFDQREDQWWPINSSQILRSDDSSKWYGLNWPERLVGRPASVAALRAVIQAGGSTLAQQLSAFQPQANEPYHRLFQGHPRFASEVCFARYLNLCGIPARENRALRGFLRQDRGA